MKTAENRDYFCLHCQGIMTKEEYEYDRLCYKCRREDTRLKNGGFSQ
jgi:Zn finger protein HypA/HybF involved in hydrogenase expression